MQPASIWAPVLENLKDEIQQDEELVLAFSPFIRSDALEVFLDTLGANASKVIVRWKVEDILAGASDLKIFDLLEEREIALYQHPSIHLKLFEFSSGRAYSGSSNITNKGLSLSTPYNEEMGTVGQLDLKSYTEIRRLCDESRKVTKELVAAIQKAVDESQIDPPIIGKVEMPPEEKKDFLISELPASKTPQAFLDAVALYLEKEEISPRMLHDMGTYGIKESDLRSDSLKNTIETGFKSHTFTKLIIEEIRNSESMSFGAITAFVHNHGQDVPLPYRSTIKEAISRLYPWLEACFEDLSISIPGARSQVIKSSLSSTEKTEATTFSGKNRSSRNRNRRRHRK